jgi:hypothetical protein
MALLTNIEDDVLALLSPLLRPAGYLEALEPYQGSLDPAEDDPDLNRVLQGRAPAVLVTTGDGDYDGVVIDRRRADWNVTLELLLVSAHLRSSLARARWDGIGGDPGIYQMIDDVRDRLFGKELAAAGAGTLIPLGYQALSRSGGKTLWRASFRIACDAIAPEPDPGSWDVIRQRINDVVDPLTNPILEADTSFSEVLS